MEEPVNFSRPSIDLLLTSAANTYRESLLAIVLTGANQDGARGLAHALMRGAQTIVQDPRTAVQAMMPQEALRAAQQAFKEPGTPAGSAGEKAPRFSPGSTAFPRGDRWFSSLVWPRWSANVPADL